MLRERTCIGCYIFFPRDIVCTVWKIIESGDIAPSGSEGAHPTLRFLKNGTQDVMSKKHITVFLSRGIDCLFEKREWILINYRGRDLVPTCQPSAKYYIESPTFIGTTQITFFLKDKLEEKGSSSAVNIDQSDCLTTTVDFRGDLCEVGTTRLSDGQFWKQ